MFYAHPSPRPIGRCDESHRHLVVISRFVKSDDTNTTLIAAIGALDNLKAKLKKVFGKKKDKAKPADKPAEAAPAAEASKADAAAPGGKYSRSPCAWSHS